MKQKKSACAKSASSFTQECRCGTSLWNKTSKGTVNKYVEGGYVKDIYSIYSNDFSCTKS